MYQKLLVCVALQKQTIVFPVPLHIHFAQVSGILVTNLFTGVPLRALQQIPGNPVDYC